ncbi:MAG TPA: hypothetical protein VN894_14260, partial [Polyangiaceae bacterium]|nr:hypothetical protein [Polyangiaceae bacterium]
GFVALSIFLSSCLVVACAAPAWQSPDSSAWPAIRQALEGERRSRPDHPWAAGVVTTVHEPRSGRTIDGRGAIAVSPERAVRMILVGGAGATMLDAWVTPERWRIAVPPAGLLRRGGDGQSRRGQAQAQEPVDLPVGFLRWLFFRPLAGTLFGGSLQPGRVLFLLRDDDAVLEVRLGECRRGELTMTTRRAHGRTERLDECRASGAITPGDWVRYEDESSGLKVDLTIESVAAAPPGEDAFRDPDGGGG